MDSRVGYIRIPGVENNDTNFAPKIHEYMQIFKLRILCVPALQVKDESGSNYIHPSLCKEDQKLFDEWMQLKNQ